MLCKLRFQIHYQTNLGEFLYIQFLDSDKKEAICLPMNHLGNGFWSIDYFIEDSIFLLQYKYFIKNKEEKITRNEGNFIRTFHFGHVENYLIRDYWMDKGHPENAFFTKAFSGLVLPQPRTFVKRTEYVGFVQLSFHIKVPFSPQDGQLIVLGNTNNLGNWNKENGLKLSNQIHVNEWSGSISFSVFPQDLEYKYAWLLPSGEIQYELGENRNIRDVFSVGSQINIRLNDVRFNYTKSYWRGAGVAIPVFSLRSRNSLGVGEFNDLKLLADWAFDAGLKMMQVLPINDTQSSKTWTDSYPYAAISVFALHPIYLHLEAIPGCSDVISKQELESIKKDLNELQVVDYEMVLSCKLDLLKKIFVQQWSTLKKDASYHSFYSENKKWLDSYALFSFFRDKFKTVDFYQWGEFSKFSETFLTEFLKEDHKDFKEIAFYFFLQYYLDKQLLEATHYAQNKGVILKGDLPIGIFKHSTDAWISPQLFNMDGQAGAPPDPFSRTGQNWGFPTYNWQEMEKDGFMWWKNRMILLEKYFGAYRIDHILGFFRIWEIPIHQVDGLLGVFNPAIPLTSEDFIYNGIHLDENRFCKPFISEEILTNLFYDMDTELINTFFEKMENGMFSFKPHFSSQKEIDSFLSSQDGHKFLPFKDLLFDLNCNLLFIKDKNQENAYHPRINLMDTLSFKYLDVAVQSKIQRLHDYYFYQMQDEFWRKKAMEKLPAIVEATNMLICGEDLGMVPACVSGVMKEIGLLTLEIQRMSKNPNTEFLEEKDIPFLSVVSPSTHDMSPIRLWWDESSREEIQRFYQYQLGGMGEAPISCSPELVEKVIDLHLSWPSLWAVFPIQDILGMDASLRNPVPALERINVPANPKNYWQYRMHIYLEELIGRNDFSDKLKHKIRHFRE